MSHLEGSSTRTETVGIENYLVTYDNCYGCLMSEIIVTFPNHPQWGAEVAIYDGPDKKNALFALLISTNEESEDAILRAAIEQLAPDMVFVEGD